MRSHLSVFLAVFQSGVYILAFSIIFWVFVDEKVCKGVFLGVSEHFFVLSICVG